MWGATAEYNALHEVAVTFQSTLPVWGATSGEVVHDDLVQFQSTLPVWGATFNCFSIFLVNRFQSTLPVWGATQIFLHGTEVIMISIHAPRVGSDGDGIIAVPKDSLFQSTLPVWGATTSWLI